MSRPGIHAACRHACLCVLFSLLLLACNKPPSDEKLIAFAVRQMQTAAGKKQLRVVMPYFSDDFQGNRQMNKAALQARIYFHFWHNPRVQAYARNVDIQLDKRQALVRCYLLVTGGQDVLPDKGRLYRIESGWRKDKEGEWRIFRANWEDVIE